MSLRIFASLLALTLLAQSGFAAAALDYEKLKSEAEKLYADRSYALAHEAYQKVAAAELPPAEKRWVEFRLADTQWRSQASTENPDTTKLDEARQKLEALVRDIARVEDRDRVWAEVKESLADFYWVRRNNNNWGAAWPLYQEALEWWAGAGDIELARDRYLSIVWRMARPPRVEPHYSYGYWGNYVPVEVLENTLKIARSEQDIAHAHYLLAMTLRNQGGDWQRRSRVPAAFEAAIKIGKSTDWFDDALFNYASWMADQGRIVPLTEGGWRSEPDFVKALELYRRLVNEFTEGETRYWQQARQQIKAITDPQVSVSVPHVFLPDSELQYVLSWRNVKQVEFALYPVELNRDVKLAEQLTWLNSIDVAPLEKIQDWSFDTKDSGNHQPGNKNLRLEQKLKPGAYLLEAKGGGVSGRDLLLVSDAAVVLKTSGTKALVLFCNALNSEPLGGAKIRLWQRWHDGSNWQTANAEKTAGADGIAVFDLSQRDNRSLELFASAILKDRQAFSLGHSYGHGRQNEPWRIYAFTDRPAYRPKETVQWKIVARRYNGSVYSTPSDQQIELRVDDPRGTKFKQETVSLNAFGSAWGSLELPETLPLGEYHVTFLEKGSQRAIGRATLFRLEEYKLPEFKVTVRTAEVDGKKKAFTLGEKVEADIQADYYFGGPVANASVEVVVYQNPFYHYWHPPREFPWFYEDLDEQRWGRWYGGQGQIIKRETLKTDATGKASLVFDTPENNNQDFEYRIEARVTDSSRREIIGNGTVRVTRQRYFVYPRPGHNLYRPQDQVRVEFNAIDANEQPVQTDALVRVTRDYWFEIWLDPNGKEVKGEELSQLRRTRPVFPPPAPPGQPGWRLKFRGYQHDEILTRSLKTDTNGVAELTFTPEREGYYRIAWTSDDSSGASNQTARIAPPIRAETTVWVATGASTDLGYRYGGVQIIADKDTFRVGEKAPVMLVAPTAGRHVLFTIEGEELEHYQLVHLEGTVKLIELPIEERHVPNIFLSAALVSDRQTFMDTKQVIVPPAKNFLTVELKPDQSQYMPRQEGIFNVITRDHNGKPVPAEVGFSLVDESVFYIQQDYAGDPRQFYFGTKRGQHVQTQTTMNQKSYARLVEGENDELLDDREMERRTKAGRTAGYYDEFQQKFESEDLAALSDAARPEPATVAGVAGGGGAPALAAAETASFRKRFATTTRGAALGLEAKEKPAQPGEPDEPAVQVRSDFRSTIEWKPDLVTSKDGTATIKVKYPDSLTGWKATARVASQANQFGTADATVRTKMPLMVRLQAPRFFLVGDSATLSAVVNNSTDQDMEVKVKLDVAGGLEIEQNQSAPTLKVPANGEARFDWLAKVRKAGEVKLKTTARSDKYSDAMEKSYLAHEHGIEKFVSKSGKVRGKDFTVKLDLPRERKPGSTALTVQVTPSMAVTMLDALPYLIDYPYGCTEQTMSRFLPSVITAKTLKDLGLQPEDVMSRLFGGIEQTNAAGTHPRGKRDLAELDKLVAAGLDRLYDFQHTDGGWGWWKEGDSDHWMTAYVVWGLTLARDAGVTIKAASSRDAVDPRTGLPAAAGANALERGADYLNKRLVEQEEHPDMQAWMLHALAVYNAASKKSEWTEFQRKAFENLWARRENLNAYTRALLALSAHHFGKTSEAKTLVQNLENGVIKDERPDTSVLIDPGSPTTAAQGVLGTAHWGEDGIYWRWSEGGVEATAFALRALLTIDPENKLIEPVSNWLIKNRRGAQWNSTRDTAIVVLALNDYLRTSGELNPELEYELLVNGNKVGSRKISGADVFNAPSKFLVEAQWIKDANEIRIKNKSARGAVYFAVEAKFFSLEEPIAPAGNEIFLKREYFKLVGRPTLLKGYVYDKQPLKDGETIKSGERVETLLTIEAKNNYEYLVFEDLKPAGLEAVEIRSGEPIYARQLKSGAVERKFSGSSTEASQSQSQATSEPAQRARRSTRRIANPLPVPDAIDFTGQTRWVYQELRDRKVALFLDKLPQGVWEIRYDLRAEVPGEFHALPALGYAMYVPEIRANGAEIRILVQDAPQNPRP